MYLRFAGFEIEPRTQHGLGVFQLAYRLTRSGVEPYVRSELDVCLDWFEEYLPVPWRLRRPGRTRDALCWFRPSAERSIAMARRMVAAIEQADVPVRMLRDAETRRVLMRREHMRFVNAPRRIVAAFESSVSARGDISDRLDEVWARIVVRCM